MSQKLSLILTTVVTTQICSYYQPVVTTHHCIGLQEKFYVIIEINKTSVTEKNFEIKCLVPCYVNLSPI